jgi:hypothetical protein
MKFNIHFLSNLAHLFLEWEMFQTRVVEKIKTHILCSVTFFRESCRLWDNVDNIVERGPQTTIWRMLIACWVTKATNILSEYVILIAFPLQRRLQERASLFFACLVPITISLLFAHDVHKNTQVKVCTSQHVYFLPLHSLHWFQRCPHADQILPKLLAPHKSLAGLVLRYTLKMASIK